MKLGDVMKLSKGNLVSIEDDKEYIIAGVQNYGAGIVNKRKVRGYELTMKKYQLIKPNQLMWCKVDTKNGAFGITKNHHKNSLASTNMALADIDISKCHPEFIEYLFRISFFHEIITKASSGTTNRKYLTPTQLFENITIPNFDKNEQLDWLEKVNSIINSGLSTELTHQLSLVKKLRQQLLQHAVQGKLVAQDPTDEPASELLKKIKAEKEKLIAEKKLKKEKELPQIKPEEIPFDIPENWSWSRLGEICAFISGNNFNSGDFKKGEGIKCIKITNAGIRCVIETDDVLPSNFKEKHKQYLVYKNDLILALTRPYIADGLKISKCPDTYNESLLNQRVAVIRSNKFINNDYVYSFLGSDFVLNIYKGMFEGKGQQPNLKKEDVTELLIPLPPLPEQNRIVEKLDNLMRYCNDLEGSIKESESQNEKLLQQVLREALRKDPIEA